MTDTTARGGELRRHGGVALEAESRVARPGLLRWLRASAALVVGLVLVQAVIAGQGWFPYDANTLEWHGYVGNVTFLVAIVQAVLVYLTRFRGRSGMLLLAASALLILLLTAQLGLGYSGRESSTAAAWHVPNGVLIFGLSVAMLSQVLRDDPR
jgi:hypothetical protein